MARARDPFGTALATLRAALRNGGFAVGSPLVAADLAPALAVSITPVREALAHLAGEGLIEERRGRGYFAPRLEVAELEGLYRLHWTYVEAALQAPPSRLAPSRSFAHQGSSFDGDDFNLTRASTERLFAAMVKADDNRLMAIAHQQVVDRLAAPRLHEAVLFDNLDLELQDLREVFSGGDLGAARVAARIYHVRRLAHAKLLAALLLELRTTIIPI